jgi:hypothetical protein
VAEDEGEEEDKIRGGREKRKENLYTAESTTLRPEVL